MIYPHNLQLEAEILWLCFFTESLPRIASLLSPSDFYNNINKENFVEAIKSYKEKGFIDLKNIKSLYAYDAEYVAEYMADKLCADLRDLSKQRALMIMAEKVPQVIKDKGSKEAVESILKTIIHLTRATQSKKTDAKSVAAKVHEIWVKTKDQEIVGIPCGYSELDNFIGGIQRGHLWVLGGYTNYGKTTLAISFITHLMRINEPLLFCSLEMSQEQIFEKIVANMTRETPNWNRKNCYDRKVVDAYTKASNSNLEITDDLYTVEQIGMKIQEMSIRGNKPLVVFIDFIQNMQGDKKTEYERITNNMIELQKMAREMDVCIFVLSQVNNQSAEFKSEIIGFKSSGAIAAAADITIQIIRDKAKELENAIEEKNITIVDLGLLVQKSRHGRGGFMKLDFDITKGLIVGH